MIVWNSSVFPASRDVVFEKLQKLETLAMIIGPKTALGGGVGTTFLSVGNAFIFGGLLATLPGQERFDEFKRSLGI